MGFKDDRAASRPVLNATLIYSRRGIMRIQLTDLLLLGEGEGATITMVLLELKSLESELELLGFETAAANNKRKHFGVSKTLV